MEEQINICPLLAIIDNSGTPNCVKENCAWWTVTGGYGLTGDENGRARKWF